MCGCCQLLVALYAFMQQLYSWRDCAMSILAGLIIVKDNPEQPSGNINVP